MPKRPTPKSKRRTALEKAGPALFKALDAVIRWRIHETKERPVMPPALFHQCMTAIRMAKGHRRY